MERLNKYIQFILVALVLWLVFKPVEKPAFNQPKIVEVEKRIHDTIKEINTIRERVQTIDLSDLQYKLDSLLVLRNKVPDTVIIRIQDTIIKEQTVLIDTLKHLNLAKDSVINGQDYVILSKDTIITLQKHKVKHKNKQILKLTIATLVSSAIAILK